MVMGIMVGGLLGLTLFRFRIFWVGVGVVGSGSLSLSLLKRIIVEGSLCERDSAIEAVKSSGFGLDMRTIIHSLVVSIVRWCLVWWWMT